jgi:hypothetical protein
MSGLVLASATVLPRLGIYAWKFDLSVADAVSVSVSVSVLQEGATVGGGGFPSLSSRI